MKLKLTRYVTHNVTTVLIIITVPLPLSFMTVVASTSERLHCEPVGFFFFQDYRETEHRWSSCSFTLAHSLLILSNLSSPILFPLLRHPLPPIHIVRTRALVTFSSLFPLSLLHKTPLPYLFLSSWIFCIICSESLPRHTRL
jgi:hypothetical protein